MALTSCAELHYLAPIGDSIVSIALFGCSLDCYSVFSARAQEPVSPHCHGQWYSLCYQLSWYILGEESRQLSRPMHTQPFLNVSLPILTLLWSVAMKPWNTLLIKTNFPHNVKVPNQKSKTHKNEDKRFCSNTIISQFSNVKVH